jgi:hypothetical protein
MATKRKFMKAVFATVLILGAAVSLDASPLQPPIQENPWCPERCCDSKVIRTLSGQVQLFSSPTSTSTAVIIEKGEPVKLLRGVNRIEPVPVKVIYDQGHPFKKGDTFYLTGWGSEGFRPAWFSGSEVDGGVFIADPNEVCAKPSEDCWYQLGQTQSQESMQEWWLEVETKNGKKGWVISPPVDEQCCFPPWGEPTEGFPYNYCHGRE